MNSTEPNWFIGTDIVSVPRISSIINKEQDSFISRIFTKGEISYCGKRNNPAIHYAGRFAAKEALKKAEKDLTILTEMEGLDAHFKCVSERLAE